MGKILNKNFQDEIADIQLKDVIDLDFLQKFQNAFSNSTNISSVSVDEYGNPVTTPSNHSKFCTMTRKSEVGFKRCAECDRKGGEEASRTRKPYLYKCHAGLIDFGAPIMLGNKQIGSILGGQVLTEEIHENYIRKIAREINVNEDMYVEEVRKIRVTDEKTIKAAAELLYIVANTVSKMGYQQYKLRKVIHKLTDDFSKISSTMEEVSVASEGVSDNQKNLNKEILNVENLSKQINNILEVTRKITNQIKILGLNASIESARAGEVGKGFGVVAKEIRKLSDNSKETADTIGNLTEDMQKCIDKTLEISKSTLETVQEQEKSVFGATSSMDDVLKLTEQLKDLANEN
ncbi:chemotaxis protein [Clostridium novyi B str. ATCC 27606]|uniref:Chemotaxis protein n=2 Tax=Clostridium TaxID=1485 RepID=A0AA40M615_CLONO|nr:MULTISPECIES: PocR ligand-binding domain-containing protein [Clostridium]KEI12920.1 chemotaxis protein [Clostridium novyi B str. NCTC 9691]KEI17661.1 chemotaxis protein [Clostridium novyi B str. ATCC 27606]KEI18168.1 chemotaxis protein [Clostridium haemolyticum NCTC 9693]KGN04091.1 chemotaxis protein [Clostridium haemolyticum NCTC 8350]OOB76586.1 chemotaxis protein [Clostridium haemolyticum]